MAVSQILTNFNLQGPAALLCYEPDLRHRVGQIRGERSVDVGLQLLDEGNKAERREGHTVKNMHTEKHLCCLMHQRMILNEMKQS